MAVQEKVLWLNWAENLRKEMMTGLTPHTTKLVSEIAEETKTTKSAKMVGSPRFWKDCQSGKGPQGCLVGAGFVVEFAPSEDQTIQQVTLRLNGTWLEIMQRVLDRRRA